MARHTLARSLTLLALALALAGCGSSRAPESTLLLITVDTLRADHLGLYGYERETTPNLDRWFEDSAIYLRSYGTTTSTSQSVTSLLTGMLLGGSFLMTDDGPERLDKAPIALVEVAV